MLSMSIVFISGSQPGRVLPRNNIKVSGEELRPQTGRFKV